MIGGTEAGASIAQGTASIQDTTRQHAAATSDIQLIRSLSQGRQQEDTSDLTSWLVEDLKVRRQSEPTLNFDLLMRTFNEEADALTPTESYSSGQIPMPDASQIRSMTSSPLNVMHSQQTLDGLIGNSACNSLDFLRPLQELLQSEMNVSHAAHTRTFNSYQPRQQILMSLWTPRHYFHHHHLPHLKFQSFWILEI
jgi:hypothetical protein